MKRGDLEVIKVVPQEPSSFEEPHISGQDVFWHDWNPTRSREWVRREDGSLEPFLAIEGIEVMGFATDGVSMAWVQASQPSVLSEEAEYAVWELWTSPYANKTADLKATKLVSMPFLKNTHQIPDLLVNKGYLALNSASPRVYRLSDGACWQVPPSPGPGLVHGMMIWVDDEEIVARIKDEYENDRTVARIKLSAMKPCDGPP